MPPEPVVKWTSEGLSPEDGLATGWVDIEVPPLLHELEVAWVWTVVPPGDTTSDDPLAIPLEYDVADGWSPLAISEALSRWVAAYVGRSDFHFVWDPTMCP